MRALLLALAACAAPSPAAKPVVPEPVPAVPVDPLLAQLGEPRTAAQALPEIERRGDPRDAHAVGEAWLANGRDPRFLSTLVALHSFKAARPYLERALEDSEANALIAVRAFREARDLSPRLVELAMAPPTEARAHAQLAAVAALGAMPGGTPALIEILSRPRTGPDELYLGIAGSAVNAAAAARDPATIEPLLVEMYRAPELLYQIRLALIAIGPTVVPLARQALRGELASVEAVHPDRWCDAGGACHATGTREYFAAEVLGDQPDPSSVPDLVAALAAPSKPAWYRDGAPSKSSHLFAIIDALRRSGSPDAAAPLRALWTDPDPALRARAIDAFAAVATDAKAVPALVKIAGDSKITDELRTRAMVAIAHLSRDPKDYAPIGKLVATLQKRAADDRRTGSLQAVADAMYLSHGYAAYAAAIAVGARCKSDIRCYFEAVIRTRSTQVADAKAIVDASAWRDDEQDWLTFAVMGRAVLEVRRQHAVDALPFVLAVISYQPSELVTLAVDILPQLAPRPCPECVDAIEKALKGASEPLRSDLELARNLYR